MKKQKTVNPASPGADCSAQFDIWLLWSIGRYANGNPMIELRGVYSTEAQARTGARMVREWAKDREAGNGMGIIPCERVDIEKRVANHTYGVSMQTLKYL